MIGIKIPYKQFWDPINSHFMDEVQNFWITFGINKEIWEPPKMENKWMSDSSYVYQTTDIDRTIGFLFKFKDILKNNHFGQVQGFSKFFKKCWEIR